MCLNYVHFLFNVANVTGVSDVIIVINVITLLLYIFISCVGFFFMCGVPVSQLFFQVFYVAVYMYTFVSLCAVLFRQRKVWKKKTMLLVILQSLPELIDSGVNEKLLY